MEELLKYLFGSTLVAGAYDKFTTPVEKYEWEGKVQMHHGEFGVLMTFIGLLTESPKLILEFLSSLLRRTKKRLNPES